MPRVHPQVRAMTIPVLGLLITLFASAVNAQRFPLDRIRLPAGFVISVFADNVPNARSMSQGARNTLFVSTRSEGKVYAIQHDGIKATRVVTIASGLNMPNGVAFRDGALYVAEVSRILRFDAIEDRLDDLRTPLRPVVVTDRFPSESHHGWKFIRFGPDGKLYVPVGAPCNVCERDPERYALIARIGADGLMVVPSTN